MAKVEVFKTNIRKIKEAKRVAKLLAEALPANKINFDLDDCDRILRIETLKGLVNYEQVITLVEKNGYTCQVLS